MLPLSLSPLGMPLVWVLSQLRNKNPGDKFSYTCHQYFTLLHPRRNQPSTLFRSNFSFPFSILFFFFPLKFTFLLKKSFKVIIQRNVFCYGIYILCSY